MKISALCVASLWMALFASSPALAAGFDCAKAASFAEKSVCADPELSKQDEILSEAYKKALAETGDQTPLRARQRQWMAERNACADISCLRGVYAKRLSEFKSAPQAQAAPAKPAPAAAAKTEKAPLKTPVVNPGAKQERMAWREKLKWPDDCEEEFALNPGSGDYSGVEATSLGDGRTLVRVTCAIAVYQASKRYYIFEESENKAILLKLKSYERDGAKTLVTEEDEVAGLETVNAAEKKLSILSLARGLGDCGAYVTYSLAGTRPVVTEARVRGCGGASETDYHKWPVVGSP